MPAACIPVPPNRHENFGLISFVSSRGQEERGSPCQVPSRQFRCLALVPPSPNPHFNLVQLSPPNRHCHLPGPANPPALMLEQLKYDRLLFRGEVKMVWKAAGHISRPSSSAGQPSQPSAPLSILMLPKYSQYPLYWITDAQISRVSSLRYGRASAVIKIRSDQNRIGAIHALPLEIGMIWDQIDPQVVWVLRTLSCYCKKWHLKRFKANKTW